MKERALLRNKILKDRFSTVLPQIMRRNKIDMWIIIAREYNEDPVIRTMLPATWLNARRRTILVVHDPGNNKSLEGYAIARYDVGDMFLNSWDPENQPNKYKSLSDKYNLSFIPFLLEGVALKPEFNLQDGMHPNEKGVKIISKTIEKKIIKLLN